MYMKIIIYNFKIMFIFLRRNFYVKIMKNIFILKVKKYENNDL